MASLTRSSAEQARRWVDAAWGERQGFFFFSFGVGGYFNEQGKYEFEHWRERKGRWPDDRERFLAEALDKSAECDVYVAPYLRSTGSRKKGNALPSDLVYADVDDLLDELRGFERLLLGPGGFLVDSGGGLHVYLHLPDVLEPAELEEWNQRLAARLKADSGWAENKVLRLPGTFNHKERAHGSRSTPVEFVEFEPAPHDWTLAELAQLLPKIPPVSLNGHAPIVPAPRPTALPPHVEKRLHEEPGDDRSKQSYGFVGLCLEAGFSDEQTLALALAHRPTTEKYGARAETETVRTIQKLRAERPQEGLSSVSSTISTYSAWPSPVAEAAFHGLAGRVVRTIEPHSEADPVALLSQFLVVVGNIMGRRRHFTVEADNHYPNLYACLIGETSKARKGSSYGHVERIGRSANLSWADRVESGLTSGEGLIWAVRDPEERPDGEEDPGVPDKRLLVFEPEFANVLRVLERQGNRLSGVVRDAWDGRVLRTLTRTTSAKATGTHISVLGHITADELRRYLDRTEVANGFGNRFLWLCVRRSKLLPDGGKMHEVNIKPLVDEIREAVQFAQTVKQTERDPEARDLWHDVYPELSAGLPGLVGALTGRAEAQTMRLAHVYALLDQSDKIRLPHLEAAIALWDYSLRSVQHVFGASLGDPTADTILDGLRRTQPQGASRTEIRSYVGGRVQASQIERALSLLQQHGLAHMRQENTGGRPADVWFYGREISEQNGGKSVSKRNRRHVPPTRKPRTLVLVQGPRDGATAAERLALEIRNSASATGRCVCGAVARYVGTDEFGFGHILFGHEPDCPAISPAVHTATGA